MGKIKSSQNVRNQPEKILKYCYTVNIFLQAKCTCKHGDIYDIYVQNL